MNTPTFEEFLKTKRSTTEDELYDNGFDGYTTEETSVVVFDGHPLFLFYHEKGKFWWTILGNQMLEGSFEEVAKELYDFAIGGF